MEDIVGEVGVKVGIGAAHIVVLVAALLDELLELGHDAVVAAVACAVHTETVVDLLAAVQTQHHVVALLVAEINDIIIDQHAVGGHCKAEVLVVDLLLLAAVGHQLFDHIKVHQRLAAKEVHFQIAAGAAVLDEEVHGALAHLKAHQGAVAVIASLRSKAVRAAQVAAMGNVQAQCLYHSVAVLEVKGHVLIDIRAPQLAVFLQAGHIVDALAQILLGHVRAAAVLCQHGGNDLVCGMLRVHGDDIVGHLVHNVHRAAAGVQHDVITVQLILMYHFTLHSRLHKKMPPGKGGIRFAKITCCCSRTAG